MLQFTHKREFLRNAIPALRSVAEGVCTYVDMLCWKNRSFLSPLYTAALCQHKYLGRLDRAQPTYVRLSMPAGV